MRIALIPCFVVTFFIASIAVAGPANLTGTWSGTATSIVCCPDEAEVNCETLTIGASAIIVQDGNLFYGTFEAEDYEHPCWGPIEDQQAVLTGTISVDNKITGVIGYPMNEINISGIGVFEAKWNGNNMEAVLRDLSDGSTTIGVFTKQ